MNKNFLLSIVALAVMASVGYAAYTNGSITDLTQVVNNQLGKVTSGGEEYLGSIFSRRGLATTTQKVGGTREPKGDLAVSVSSKSKLPLKDVVAGANAFTFAEYVFDARKSGEDVKTTIFKARFTGTSNTADDLTNCQLFDVAGNTSLTTGPNIVNPSNSVSTGDDITFNLDNGLITPKGGTKVVVLECNFRANPDGIFGVSTYALGLSGSASSVTSIGMLSNKTVVARISRSNGQAMTLRSSGQLSFVLDSSTPPAREIKCGQYNLPVTKIKVSSGYEDISLRALRFRLNGTVSPEAVSRYILSEGYNLTRIGEGVFVNNRVASTTLSQQFVIPKDSSKVITVSVDLAPDNSIQPCQVGKTIAIDYDGYFEAVGMASGARIPITTSNSNRTSSRLNKLAK